MLSEVCHMFYRLLYIKKVIDRICKRMFFEKVLNNYIQYLVPVHLKECSVSRFFYPHINSVDLNNCGPFLLNFDILAYNSPFPMPVNHYTVVVVVHLFMYANFQHLQYTAKIEMTSLHYITNCGHS